MSTNPTGTCGRVLDHPAHRWMLGRVVQQCPGLGSEQSTPCSSPPCDTGPGEPCDRHEREWSHAEGNHELCDSKCNTTPAPLSPEREAEIREVRDGQLIGVILHPTRLGEALRDLLAELDRVRGEWDRATRAFDAVMAKHDKAKAERDELRKRVAELEGAETATEYGIRVPGADWPEDGVLQDGDTFNLKDQQGRLLRFRDCWPDAVLVSRPVHRGEWAEVR